MSSEKSLEAAFCRVMRMASGRLRSLSHHQTQTNHGTDSRFRDRGSVRTFGHSATIRGTAVSGSTASVLSTPVKQSLVELRSGQESLTRFVTELMDDVEGVQQELSQR